MKIREFFAGTEEEREAQKRIKEIQEKKRPNEKERKELAAKSQIAGRIGRRRFMTGGLALVAAGITAVSLKPGDSANPSPRQTQQASAPQAPISQKETSLDQEALTDQVIARAEQGFTAFEEKVMPLIQGLESQGLKDNLKGPFQVMDFNRENPDKNFLKLKAKMAQAGIENHTNPTQSPYSFNFIAQSSPGLRAGYNPVSKTMALSEDFDPDSLYDMLVLFHELKHVIHDTNIKQSFQTREEYEAYIDFCSSQRRNIVVNDELDAYAFEIELLNLMMDNELFEAAKEGRPINPAKLRDYTQKEKDLQDIGGLIFELSQLYYPDGFRGIHFNAESPFVERIAAEYRNRGQKVFTKLGDGRLVEYYSDWKKDYK